MGRMAWVGERWWAMASSPSLGKMQAPSMARRTTGKDKRPNECGGFAIGYDKSKKATVSYRETCYHGRACSSFKDVFKR
ncbi:hypothetical protein VTI28DRAFT_8460 [Corynascus sepedonium]